jgi:hypothetical protein
MHHIPRSLPGLALLGLLALGCAQGEGDRCQVTSDCASGLECQNGDTGNGKCVRPGTSSGNDAAPDTVAKPSPDAAPDSVATPVPDAASETIAKLDAAPDAAPDAAAEAPADQPTFDGGLDLTPVGPELGLDGATPDTPAVDSAVPRAPDAPESEAGAIDATPRG